MAITSPNDLRPALQVVDLDVPRIVMNWDVLVDHETGCRSAGCGVDTLTFRSEIKHIRDPSV